MDLNDIKAGKYQLVSQRWDQITSKPGEPLDYIRHRRGDVIELNSEDAKRLVAAGAVVKPGQLEQSRAEQARELAERAQREYEAVLAGLPEDVRAEIAPGTVSHEPKTPPAGGTDGGTGGTQTTPEEPPFGGLNRGSGTEAWRAFAVSEAAADKRLSEEAAGEMSRDQIAELFLGPKEQS